MSQEYKKIYKSKYWENVVRPAVISRDKDICFFCGKLILKRRTIHHIQELNENNFEDYDIAFNLDNLVECHDTCHNIHHDRFGYKKKKTIVNEDLSINYEGRKV